MLYTLPVRQVQGTSDCSMPLPRFNGGAVGVRNTSTCAHERRQCLLHQVRDTPWIRVWQQFFMGRSTGVAPLPPSLIPPPATRASWDAAAYIALRATRRTEHLAALAFALGVRLDGRKPDVAYRRTRKTTYHTLPEQTIFKARYLHSERNECHAGAVSKRVIDPHWNRKPY